MSDIKISICIASYNQQEFLSDAIESCLTQTVKPHEILVCNDGSTDHSLAIAKSYENQGVKVIDQVNKGLASARNTLLMNATGDYILYLDSDDMFMETCIEKITKVIEETNADIVAPSFKTFGMHNQEVILAENPQINDFWSGNRLGYFSAIRRSKLLEIGGYSPRMTWGYEDYALWFDLLKRGSLLKTISEPLVMYRTRANSMITTAQAHHEELMAQIKKDHIDAIPKKKIALVMICLNAPYWQYIKPMVESARKFFLPHHNTDFLLWSDMPQEMANQLGVTVFHTEPVGWPLPTLMRYSLFLQQEEKLKEYDYVFYCDADMLWVNPCEEEILGSGLTAALHPMYAFKAGLRFPLEPNPESSAYITVPKHYFAGGFQGGVSGEFLKAMKVMKKRIDEDFTKNYVAIWNDESHWNRYLLDNQPTRILSPSYIYPDSLIKEYYEPIWGCAYKPILVTLTKAFSVSKEGGAAVRKNVEQMAALKNEPRNY
jgi:histo-blood group ABO system transferase